MDPFTITATVLRITGSCFSAGHKLWEIHTKWKHAPRTVADVCSQLRLTAASLSQLQSLLLSDDDVLQGQQKALEALDTTLTHCLSLSIWLEKLMEKITKGILNVEKGTWKMKFKTLWNEDEIKELLEKLHYQQSGINLLLNLLQMDTLKLINRSVRKHGALLHQIRRDIRYLRKTHAMGAPESILESGAGNDSVFSHLLDDADHEKHPENSNYETQILRSKVYQKALTGVLHPIKEHKSDTASTGTIVDSTDTIELQPTALKSLEPESNLNDLPLAIHAAEIQESIKALHIVDVFAKAMVDIPCTSIGSSDIKKGGEMHMIQRIDRYRYRGRPRMADGKLGMPQNFNRERFLLLYVTKEELGFTTTKDSTLKGQTCLSYVKGEYIHFEFMHHQRFWGGHIVRDDGEENSGVVDTCDLNFREDLQHLDSLLAFFSLPIKGLDLENLDDARRVITEMLTKESRDAIAPLWAHCRSIEQLHKVSTIFDEY